MLQVAKYLFASSRPWREEAVERFVDPEDGHTFSVRWATPAPSLDPPRIYVVVPGMLSTHNSKYIGYFVAELVHRGPTCVFNMPLLADSATGETLPDYSDDRYLRHFLELLGLRYPDASLILIGLSLGGVLAIKCQDLATEILTVCTPIRGQESWDAIQGFYFSMMRGAFVTGPLAKLLYRRPTKWATSVLAILKAKSSKEMVSVVEHQTTYVIGQMSIEKLVLQLPEKKVTMVHSQDDQIVPFVPTASPLFSRVRRMVMSQGGHLLFTADQVTQICGLI